MHNKTQKINVFKKLQATSYKLQASSIIVKPRSRGFTIIEVMISMMIFSVLITVGMGAALDAINQHKQSEGIRTAMDNINFVLEDMSRNIRLGSNLHCGDATSALDAFGVPTPHDCTDPASATNVLVFNDLNNHVVTYTISPPYSTNPNSIIKQVDSAPYQIISPPEVTINYAQSGFIVRGAYPFPPSGGSPDATHDYGQPTVVIRLSGYVTYRSIRSNFAVETTVALRALDS
jgi:prepilin-type N-terminal cleavage/methylation domain-containing protein